jgi:hypothetical protein
MKPIQKDEIYENVRQFMKSRGIEMQDGSYPRSVQKACSILADAINLSQRSLVQAKVEIDRNLDRMRQVIHEKTAPKTAPKPAEAPKSAAPPRKPKSKGAKKRTGKR